MKLKKEINFNYKNYSFLEILQIFLLSIIILCIIAIFPFSLIVCIFVDDFFDKVVPYIFIIMFISGFLFLINLYLPFKLKSKRKSKKILLTEKYKLCNYRKEQLTSFITWRI